MFSIFLFYFRRYADFTVPVRELGEETEEKLQEMVVAFFIRHII